MGKHKKFIKALYNGVYGDIGKNLKGAIEYRYPELMIKDWKVGDWVVCWMAGVVTRLESKFSDNHFYTSHVSEANGCNQVVLIDNIRRKAKNGEIIDHLIKKSEDKGFMVGAYFMHDAESYPGLVKKVYQIKHYDYFYNGDLDTLTLDNWVIYDSGKWAEVVEAISKDEAEKELGKKII